MRMSDMASPRLFGGNGNCAGASDSQKSKEERIAMVQMREARQRRFNVPPLFTCDPLGKDDNTKLENHLRGTVEPELRDQAGVAEIEGRGMSIVVAISDKSWLTGITLLGGEGCGDASLGRFIQATALAMADVEAANGAERNGLYLTRLGTRSDEGAQIIGAPGLSPNADLQFKAALALEMGEMAQEGLAGVTYTADVQTQHGVETRELSLRGFSRMLAHPEIVVAGNFKVSRPTAVSGDEKAGFILDVIRRLENSEAGCFDRLPRLYNGNGGLPEVRTPFKGSLKANGAKSMAGGTFVEIKLAMSAEQASAFLPFTSDVRDGEGRLLEAGTRKGFSEIFSTRAGMRFLNTFFGKARSNSILTPIALGMSDVLKSGVDVVPVSGGYLQYWLDAQDGASTAEMVADAIRARINAKIPTDDAGFISLKLEPSVLTMDAAGVNLDDVRAKFILKSLGKDIYPVEALSRADFLVNFLWLVNERVQREVFGGLATEENGRMPMRLSELDMIQSVRRICSIRRTIRDTEDLIWTLRNDSSLPNEIKARKEGIEKEFWDFSWERQPKMFELLTGFIKRAMENGHA
ncbi:hypothetical protein L0Y65_00475 [Candidatus Micrarchaeota archaeon]|nr:hypothetical protein [Candidatus Micrarchaeota archaeon]